MNRLVPALAALLCAAGGAWANDRSPCPQIVFVGKGTPSLSDDERRLVCGSPGTEGWSRIPLDQAQYFLTAYLQQLGYQNPVFSTSRGRLLVDTGGLTLITRLKVAGLPKSVKLDRLRRIVGQPLTPKKLDEITAALKLQLQIRGYACPRMDLSADASNGVVSAAVRAGRLYTFGDVRAASLPGLDPLVFSRYLAFHKDQLFDPRLLQLSAERTQNNSLFLSDYYEVSCSSAGLAIVQRAVEGKPHSVSIGAGFSTEGYWTGQAQWLDSRIGDRADDVEGTLITSFIQESAQASMHLFISPESRVYLMPLAQWELDNEERYSDYYTKATLAPGTSWDFDGLRVDVYGGPTVNYVQMVSGIGPSGDTFFSLDTLTKVTSHMYEYYANQPQQGWQASLETDSRFQGADSEIDADRIKLSGETLWNLGDYLPPSLILGDRGYAATTYVGPTADPFAELPPTWRYFVGGDEDFRGASLQEIPTNDNGFLTAVYDGVELRLGDVLPDGLQPFVFLDGAMMGEQAFELDPDVYYAPGVGLRWALPFGAIRTEVAHGYIWRRDDEAAPYTPRWQFFLTFGEEF